MELNLIQRLFGKGAKESEMPTLQASISGATYQSRMEREMVGSKAKSSALMAKVTKSFWGLYNQNPAAIIQDIRPTKSYSAVNDFIGMYLDDASFYDFLDEMCDKDPSILGTERLVASQVLGFPILLEADDPDSVAQQQFAEYVETHLSQMGGMFGFRQALFNLVHMSRRHGFCVVEIEWQVNDDGAIMPRAFYPRHPGSFRFLEDGTLLYREAGKYEVKPAPPRKFVVSVNAPEYANPYGKSELQPLRWAYYLKKAALIAFADSTQYHGLPLLIANVPEGVPDSVIDSLETEIAAMRNNSGLILKNGITINSVQRGMASGADSPQERFIDIIDRLIVRYLTGSTLSTMENGATGSLAQSITHADVSRDKLNPLARVLEDVVNRGIIQPIHELNIGAAFPCPRWTVDTSENEDLADIRESYKTAHAIGIKTSAAQYYEMTGLRPPLDDDDTINPAPVPTSPLGGGFPFAEAKTDAPPFDGFAEKEEIDEAYQNWRSVTNMTVNELERWKDHPASKQASLSRAPIIRQLHLLTTPKKDWTGREVTSARRVFSFVERMRNGEQGKDISKRFPISKRDVSLLNWGHNPTGKSVAAIIRELDNAAKAAKMWDMAEVVSFASPAERQERYQRFVTMLESLSDELSKTAALDVRQAMLDGVAEIERTLGVSGLTLDNAADLLDIPDLTLQMQRTVAGGKALGMQRILDAAGERIMGLPVRVPIDEFPPEFRDALDWMQSRDIMNRDELRAVTEALSRLTPGGRDAREIERAFREEVLALARVPEPEVAAIWQEELKRIVESGDTRIALLDFKDKLNAGLASPLQSDAYTNTVFRTEVANAYAAQRRQVEEDPDLEGVIVGKRFFNPNDGASRPGHAAMNGVVVAIGSPADIATRPGPPWDYACRCDHEYIIAGEPLNETPDALSRANRIERFN